MEKYTPILNTCSKIIQNAICHYSEVEVEATGAANNNNAYVVSPSASSVSVAAVVTPATAAAVATATATAITSATVDAAAPQANAVNDNHLYQDMCSLTDFRSIIGKVTNTPHTLSTMESLITHSLMID